MKALGDIVYDLVLMDVQMPEMDGIEATRRIRDPFSYVLNHHIPIIAMTAHAMQGDRDFCIQAGMNDYIAKPIEVLTLFETVSRWLPVIDSSGEITNQTIIQVKPLESEETSHQDIFDRVSLYDRLMEDSDLMRKVLAVFLQDTPTQIQTLKDFLITGDLTGAVRQVHTIKGASANVGAKKLQRLAAELEKTQDLDKIRQGVNMIEYEFERLREIIVREVDE
jgi:CheY-like chemotaxis protein